MINITLPDNSVRQYPEGTTSLEVALSISEGLARNVLAAKVNGEVWDATRPINSDVKLQLLTWNDTEGKATMWHSSAHLMAEAIEQLFPGVKFGIGPDIENGFYYDMDFGDRQMTPEDLPAIEAKMLALAREKQGFKRREVSKALALGYFTNKNDEYKLELISDLEDGQITFYESGSFTDLCRGPHLPDTSPIKAVKLLNIAGAYWRGDEKRKMLTRIYGITFPKQKELDEYLVLLEEAKKRDHRKLGRELELFTFSQKVGQGLPLWLPKGAMLRERLERFLKNLQQKAGYLPVMTPHIGNVELYKTSGHFQKYGKDSFQPINTPIEGEQFMLKPMNCPH
ncbi:MAG TPA: TGS domain-containing protein, partial [Bacteroidales bacterium]|nr:TGS domain-containing protein [Bacteroidales bacterium]